MTDEEYHVFLSHNSQDKPQVEALALRLRERGLNPFLDKWCPVPGEPWQEAIEEVLRVSASCAVFLGPGDISPWHNEEMRAALNRQVRERTFRVIPVLLPGANRTGRRFTGNGSGDTLTRALHRAGFANQSTSHQRDDGLQLRETFLTAVARCAPPKNKPTRDEMDNYQGFLVRELALLPSTRVVLTLGRIAFDRYRRLLRKQGTTLPRLAFHHGACYRLEPPLPALVVSYHSRRQNTQTGRLTEEMLDEVFAQVHKLLDERGE